MAKVALILGCNIPYTFKFGYIISNKLKTVSTFVLVQCCACWFQTRAWVWLAMTEAIWKRVGACVFNSCINASSVNSPRWSIPIRLNGEGLVGFFRHKTLHSAVIMSKNFVVMHFCSSWCAKTALAIEGTFPPFKIQPIFCRYGLKVDVRGLVWEGVCTAICGMLTHIYIVKISKIDAYIPEHLFVWVVAVRCFDHVIHL